jgi:hypothetical protein
MSRAKLPIALPGGQLLPHMSARHRHEIMDTVFEMLGGTERLAHEADREYWEFMKLYGKGLPRAVSTEHSVGGGVEDLLDQLDRAEKATVIEGKVTVLSDD